MPARKLPPNSEIVKMYRSGMSSGEIAEKCGVKPVTVVSALCRIGEPLRSTKEAARLKVAKGRQPRTAYWTGRTQPAAMVEKRALKIRGPNHYLWKGGKSRRAYRSKIEKVSCAACEARQNLCVHHKNFDHYDNAPENLQILCVSCHVSLHKKAYWASKRKGRTPRKSNGPVGWKRANKV